MNERLDLGSFVEELKDSIKECWELVINHGVSSGEEEQYLARCVVNGLDDIGIRISSGLEVLGLLHTHERFVRELSGFKERPSFIITPYMTEYTCPELEYLERYASSLALLCGASNIAVDDHFRLRRILLDTGHIVLERETVPSKEQDVVQAVMHVLVHAFPDTVRNPSIPHVLKIFKPDLGVRSLKTAIEYKYASSLTEVKTAVGQIYEDMKGYQGSSDWTRFYSIIYMTKPFITDAQLQSEMALAEVRELWTPLLVVGVGDRSKKRRRRAN